VEVVRGVSLFGEVRSLFDREFAGPGTFSEVRAINLDEAPNAADPRAFGPVAPRRFTVGVGLAVLTSSEGAMSGRRGSCHCPAE
jgi:hypothetical protein